MWMFCHLKVVFFLVFVCLDLATSLLEENPSGNKFQRPRGGLVEGEPVTLIRNAARSVSRL